MTHNEQFIDEVRGLLDARESHESHGSFHALWNCVWRSSSDFDLDRVAKVYEDRWHVEGGRVAVKIKQWCSL